MLLLLLSLSVASPLADAVAAGDCETVLTTDPPSNDWALPRARCLLARDRPADALEELASAPSDGPLAPYKRLLQGQALVALGEAEPALHALRGVSLPGAAGEEAKLASARLLASLGDVSGVRAAVAGLKGPESTFLVAQAAEKSGDSALAIRTYGELWVSAAGAGFDKRAAEASAGLGKPLPDLVDGRADAEKRRRALTRAYRHQEALELADLLLTPSSDSQRLTRAGFLHKARLYPEAAAAYGEVLGAPEKAVGSADMLYQYGLSYARTGDYDQASAVYRRLIAQHPGTDLAELAHYKLGYMEVDRSNCEAALPLLREHRTKHPGSDHTTETLWFEGRCLWRSGDYPAANKLYQELLTTLPGSSLAPGAAYWSARALGKAGDAEAEKAALGAVIKRWPTSGWSYFATVRLGTQFVQVPDAVPPPLPASWEEKAELKAARALLGLGLGDWARDRLQPLRKQVSGKDASLALAWLLIDAGDFQGGRKLAKPYCVAVHKGGDPVAQQACTPRPESGIVNATAVSHDLHPLLPFGIMNAESNLDPSVKSWAGAMGLMQLMPKEAARLHAPRFPDRPFRAEDLYHAPYNALLGTSELGERSQSLVGVLEGTDLPAVIASYNGGEEAVRRWIGDEKPEFDEFAEDISYGETRRYVKRVLGFVMAYRWVYGDR